MDGFSLIELMIVVAIVAILAAIAYPAYQDQIRKTRRADCQGTMMEAAGAAERFFTENNTYTGFSLGTGANDEYIDQCPPNPNETAVYDLSVTIDNGGAGFTLSAAPTGAQAGDRCGTLTLNQAFQKGVTGATGGADATTCW
jgi:type IV pilus assembly protein PilE